MRFHPTSGMAKRLALLAVPLLAVLLALPATTYAQRFTGDLSGTVVDESGGVIPGADVIVVNQASQSERRTVTNSDGFFAFAALPREILISVARADSPESIATQITVLDTNSAP